MNVHEALEYTENLDLSSIDDLSDDEDFISRGRLIILPPNDGGHRDTDEYELLPNNLRSQLSAGTTVDVSTSSSNISLGA